MGDPGAVVSGPGFAQLVLPHPLHGFFVGLGIVADGNLRSHSAHGVDTATVTGVDEQLDVGMQEGLLHGDVAAVGQHMDFGGYGIS